MAGVHKTRTPPTPGFVIVNTNDGDDKKQGARYEYQYERKTEKREEIMKMLQGIYI